MWWCMITTSCPNKTLITILTHFIRHAINPGPLHGANNRNKQKLLFATELLAIAKTLRVAWIDLTHKKSVWVKFWKAPKWFSILCPVDCQWQQSSEVTLVHCKFCLKCFNQISPRQGGVQLLDTCDNCSFSHYTSLSSLMLPSHGIYHKLLKHSPKACTCPAGVHGNFATSFNWKSPWYLQRVIKK